MFITPDGVNLYTEEDVTALRAERDATATQQFTAGTEYGSRSTDNRLRSNAIDFFKSEVSSGSMTKDDAESIFNGLANAIGWDEATLSTLWTVTVDFNGETIAEFSDIEADDEDGATDEVLSNFEVDVDVHFTISYNGDTHRNTVNTTYEFDTADLEVTATEQD